MLDSTDIGLLMVALGCATFVAGIAIYAIQAMIVTKAMNKDEDKEE